MADIDVVPKQGGKGWLMWLILAIAAVAVLWMLMGRNDDRDQPAGAGISQYWSAPPAAASSV